MSEYLLKYFLTERHFANSKVFYKFVYYLANIYGVPIVGEFLPGVAV